MTLGSSIKEWVTVTLGPVDPDTGWESAERWRESFAPLVAEAEAPAQAALGFGDQSRTPGISVVLPAGPDDAALGAKVAAFGAHSLGETLELVLVGDGRGDAARLESIAAAAAARYAVPVRLAIPEAIPTPAHAFALGASIARGDLLLFVHPDAAPSSEASLTALAAFAREHPAAGVIGARALDPSREFVLDAGIAFDRPDRRPAWTRVDRGHRRYRLDPEFARSGPAPAVGDAGLLIRREALDAAGGWPAGYLGDWFAAADLCHRVWNAGWQVWLAAGAEFERTVVIPAVPRERDPAWIHDAWLHDRRWSEFLERREVAPLALRAASDDAIRHDDAAESQLALDRLRCLLEPDGAIREAAWRDQARVATPLGRWGDDVRTATILPAGECAVRWLTACAAGPGSDRLIVLAGDELEPGAQVRIQVLDPDLSPVTDAAAVPLRLDAMAGADGLRLDDVRLTGDGRQWLATASAHDPCAPGEPRDLLLRLDLDRLELRAVAALPDEAASEGLPVAVADGVALVARLGPTRALLVDPDTGDRRPLAGHDAPRLAETLRGSSPLCPVDEGHLGIVRDTIAGPVGIRRVHRFALFAADFRLAALSLPFTVGEDGGGACNGLAVAGGRVVVACVDGAGARLLSLAPEEIGARMATVDSMMADGPMAWPDDPSGAGPAAPDPVTRLIAAAAAATCLEVRRTSDPAADGERRATPIDRHMLAHGDAALAAAGADAVDLVVLDAAAGFAQALDDVIHAERVARPNGALAIRGVALPGMGTATAASEPGWARGGDGWKILPCLAALRPDLRLTLAAPGPDAPRGMLLVTGLDPANEHLARGRAAALDAFGGHVAEHPPALRDALATDLPAAVSFDAALLALATGSVPRLQAAARAAGAPPPFGHLPVYVPAFNNPSYLAGMVRQLRTRRLMPVIVDNASTAPGMLALLDWLWDVPVVRMTRNLGGQFFAFAEFYALLPELFCLTDPDLGLNPALPEDFLAQLVDVTERFRAGKAGFALDVTDREALGDHVFLSKLSGQSFRAWEREEQFWRNRLGETPDGDPIFEGFIDTTFFLMNKRFAIPELHGSGLRVAGRFTARHLPWYRDCPIASDAEMAQYAASRAVGQWNHGGGGAEPDILAIVPSRGRPDHARACVDALRANSTRCRVVLAVDDDDPALPAYRAIPGATAEPGPAAGPWAAVNRVAAAHADRYRHLAVVMDDAIVRTGDWDAMAASAIWDLPEGIATVGPDEGIPLVLLRSSVARRVGRLLPPDLPQGEAPSYWAGLAAALGGLRRRPDIVVDRIPEHAPGSPRSQDAPDRPVRFEPGREGVLRLREIFLEAVRRLGPALFVEVGAHEADASAAIRQWLPGCRVVALEANPAVHALHRERLAGLGVEYLDLAAARTAGRATLHVPLATGPALQPEAVPTGRASLLPRAELAIHAEIEVPAVALDDLFADAGPAATAMWIDVEGAAHDVLHGASRTLGDCRLALVEVEGEAFRSGQHLAGDVERLMAGHGFVAVARDGEIGDRQFNILFAKGDGLAILDSLLTGPERSPAGAPRWRRDVDPGAVRASLALRSPQEVANATYLSQEFGYAYFVVPKAASSLIRTTLNRQLARRLGAPAGDAWYPDSSPHADPRGLGMDRLTDILLDPGWRLAAFARNPYSRLLSMYLHLERQFAETGRAHYTLANSGFDPDEMPGFAEFVSAIAAQTDEQADWHWKSQLALLPVPPDRLTFLGRYERLDVDYWELGRCLFGPEGFGDPALGLPTDTLATHAPRTDAEAHLAAFYTPELRRLVADRYAADFAAFGYDPERLDERPASAAPEPRAAGPGITWSAPPPARAGDPAPSPIRLAGSGSGRHPFRVSGPGRPPLEATLEISGRSWSVAMAPRTADGTGSPLTISGESDDTREALLLLAGPAVRAASQPREPETTWQVSPTAPLDVIARLRVCDADSPKVRLGSPHDGGYVIPESLLREATSLVSIGISHDSRFEEDWFELTGKPVEMYDGSCDCPGICARWPEELGQRIRYTRRHVGDGPEMVPLGNVLAGRRDVLLKMDAEGAEYHALTRADLASCAGIVLEVHFLNAEPARQAFTWLLDKLDRDFVLVHLHGKHFCGSAPLPEALAGRGDGLPLVLELTFVNRRIHAAEPALTRERFPVPGLDAANLADRPDLELEWVNRGVPAPVSIVTGDRRDPGRGVVYHVATGGVVHMLNLLGNSLSYAERHGAVVAPVFEICDEWYGLRFRDFFRATTPALADAELQSALLDELPERLRLPIAGCREIRTQWIEQVAGDCIELTGDLAGQLNPGLPWGMSLESGQAILTGGRPWPPPEMPGGFAAAVERIALADRVRDEINRRAAALPARYIGAHFRNTDTTSDLRTVTVRVREAARRTGIVDVVWATDDVDTLPEAAARLPELRLHPASDLPAFRGSGARALHFMSDEHLATLGLTRDDLQVAAIHDLYALIRADAFVPTGAPATGIPSGWTDFVEHLRARPETAERFFRLPVAPTASASAPDPGTRSVRVAMPGLAERDATLHTDGRSWTIAVQDGAGRPITASGASADGLAALSALFGALGSGAGPALTTGAEPMASPRRAFPVIDHAATPPPRPVDWYRPPTDAEIAEVLRGFDYGRVKAGLPGKWVIAYSVYGDDPFYTVGALKNAVLGPRLFPEFVSRFYVGASVPRWIVQILEQMPKVEVVDMTDRPEGPRAMFWRFLAPGDPDVDVYLCRDTDSRLTVRDRAAVNEWLASDKAFHIMRDAAAGAHDAPIVGCMWGCRGAALRDVRDLIRAAGEYPDVKGVDQEFLWAHVYPRALASAMIHDECTQFEPPDFDARRPFPTPMRDPWDRAAPVIRADDTSP